MTMYTREELNGVRKYKRELKARVRRVVSRVVIAILAILLVGKVLSLLGLDSRDELSTLDKYPTRQSYIDYLNSLASTEDYLTAEDVYGTGR